jgi:LAGLIDADG DNA endonuclease family protein
MCVYLNSRGVLLFKHRILGLPVGECSRIIRTPSFVVEGGKDAMCRFVEGYQYADGSFVAGKSPCIRITSSSISIIRKFLEIADSFNVAHSLSKDHKDVGFSLRISAEDSMEKWLKHVRLLNPVQISKFLVWKRFSECPPGLFFSHYVDLLSGRRELGSFSNGFLREKQRTHLYMDSVDLVTQFVLAKQDLTFSEIAEATVARTVNAAANSVGRLVRRGFVKTRWQDRKTVAMLTSEGQESVFDLRKTWLLLRKQNSRISPLKSYELAS